MASEGMYSGQVRHCRCAACTLGCVAPCSWDIGSCTTPASSQWTILVFSRILMVDSLQFIYAGKKATLNIGNIKPIGDMPEGSIICNVEEVRVWPHQAEPLLQSSSAAGWYAPAGVAGGTRSLLTTFNSRFPRWRRKRATAARWRAHQAITALWWRTTQRRA